MNGEQPSEGHAHHDEVQQALTFLKTHGTTVLLALCVVVAVIVVTTIVRQRGTRKLATSAMLLSSAQNVEDLSQLVTEHGDAPTAPLARLRLAKAHYDAGNADVALATYDEFLALHPDNEFADAARLGRVHCIEARGQLAEAEAAFAAFAAADPKHYLAPQAVLGRGRCLEGMGRYEEARAVYEDFVAANPDSGWVGTAEESLELVRKKIKKLEPETSANAS